MRPDKKKGRGGKHISKKTTSEDKTDNGSNVCSVEKNPDPPAAAVEQAVLPSTLAVSKPEKGDNDGEITETKKYAKRKVFSNWERYCEPVSMGPEQDDESDGIDFEKLLQNPSSGDGHFMFKSEKIEPPPTSDLFALDLNLLSTTLKAIPFYKLLDFPLSYFSAADIETMDKEAEIHARSIQTTYNKTENENTQSVSNTLDKSTTSEDSGTVFNMQPKVDLSLDQEIENPLLHEIPATIDDNIVPAGSQQLPTEILKTETLKTQENIIKTGESDPHQIISQSKEKDDLDQLRQLLDTELNVSDTAEASSFSTSNLMPCKDDLKSAAQPAQDDLEAWLDTVLDDDL